MDTDAETTLGELKERLTKFREERDWEKFHDLKNLAEALTVEAGELQELMLWKSAKEIEILFGKDEVFAESVRDELADVICFCINIALTADIDIATAVDKKISKNEQKYPIEHAKGRSTKYTNL